MSSSARTHWYSITSRLWLTMIASACATAPCSQSGIPYNLEVSGPPPQTVTAPKFGPRQFSSDLQQQAVVIKTLPAAGKAPALEFVSIPRCGTAPCEPAIIVSPNPDQHHPQPAKVWHGITSDPGSVLSSYMWNVIAASADRQVIVASLEFTSESTSWETLFMRSTDGGLSWHYLSELRKPTYMATVEPFPIFGAGDSVAVFVDIDLGNHSASLAPDGRYCYASHDGGKTWEAPLRLPLPKAASPHAGDY